MSKNSCFLLLQPLSRFIAFRALSTLRLSINKPLVLDFVRLSQRTAGQPAAEREWQPFHMPKNLAMALMVEAAELAEIFQWMTPEQSQAARGDLVLQEQVADEVADVLLYLVQIADHTGVCWRRPKTEPLLRVVPTQN